jgi:hypothetical protein
LASSNVSPRGAEVEEGRTASESGAKYGVEVQDGDDTAGNELRGLDITASNSRADDVDNLPENSLLQQEVRKILLGDERYMSKMIGRTN